MTETYAARVVKVLAGHFPGMADETTAEVVTDLIGRHWRDPEAPFEVIVDDPAAAKWRLHADPTETDYRCPDCGRETCTGEDCYWPDEAGIQRPERPASSAPGGAGKE